jgi:hypothetical protein
VIKNRQAGYKNQDKTKKQASPEKPKTEENKNKTGAEGSPLKPQ